MSATFGQTVRTIYPKFIELNPTVTKIDWSECEPPLPSKPLSSWVGLELALLSSNESVLSLNDNWAAGQGFLSVALLRYVARNLLADADDATGSSFDQKLLYDVQDAFVHVDKVVAIYVQSESDELQILVAVSIDRYDDALMDTLIDLEYQIRKAHPRLMLEFSYLPVGGQSISDLVHSSARRIFRR